MISLRRWFEMSPRIDRKRREKGRKKGRMNFSRSKNFLEEDKRADQLCNRGCRINDSAYAINRLCRVIGQRLVRGACSSDVNCQRMQKPVVRCKFHLLPSGAPFISFTQRCHHDYSLARAAPVFNWNVTFPRLESNESIYLKKFQKSGKSKGRVESCWGDRVLNGQREREEEERK